MLIYFRFPRFQPLAFLLLTISFFGFSPAAFSLPNEDAKAFRAEYMKGCLEGISQFGLDPVKGKKYCQCTLTNLLKLPDEKLRSLTRLTESQLQQDTAIQGAITGCLETFSPPNPNQNQNQ